MSAILYKPAFSCLNVLELESLEYRKVTLDLALCYKIINGISDASFDSRFNFAPIAAAVVVDFSWHGRHGHNSPM